MTQDTPQQDVPDVSPGTRLARAREHCGISRARVAEQLRLSQVQVEALERADYARLPEATYVRGYIRAYARLVDLDADEMVRLFDQELPGGERSRLKMSLATVGFAWRGHGEASLAKVSTAAVVMTVLAVLWYAGEHHMLVAADAPENALVADDAVMHDDGSDSAVGETPALEPVVADYQGLRLRLREPSWVEIVDATNARLVHAQLPAGDFDVDAGAPPYRVFLGNARGVDIAFQGRSVDFPLHGDSLSARFTVAASPSAVPN